MIWTLGFLVLVYSGALITTYLIQERIIFFPEKLPDDYKYIFPFEFKEYFLDEDSGASINVLYFKTKQASKGVVLYFHGNAGNMALWGLRAENFLSKGYDVLMYDYKGFGKSRGQRTEKNMLKTAENMYQFALNHTTPQKLIVYGVSLGSGLATYVASKYDVKQLILETPYYSILAMAKRFVPFLPVKLILKYQFRTDVYLRHVSAPTVVIHGTDDELIPYNHSLKLKKIKPDIQLITIDKGTHNDLDLHDEYHKGLEKIT